jgi:hypothetical protein
MWERWSRADVASAVIIGVWIGMAVAAALWVIRTF